MTHKVFVVGNNYNICATFDAEKDFDVIDRLGKASIVVFPGGPDVNPSLYGMALHPRTYFQPDRDSNFKFIHDKIAAPNVLKIGICGGGQFLHVMNGGKMYQDCDGHAGRPHHIRYVSCHNHPMDPLSRPAGVVYEVTSTHHQIMRFNPDAELWGYSELSTFRDFAHDDRNKSTEPGEGPDVEILYYRKANSLCFQPHPEYGHYPTRELFFKCVRRILSQRTGGV